MGALLAFAGPGAPPADAWARARGWFEQTKRLPVLDEAADVVKYGRLHGAASRLARDARGWLAVAGTWVREDVATDDTAALLASSLDGLDGLFAAVRKDGATVHATTDPFGRLHLFMAATPAGTWLSTSATALACAVGGTPDPLGAYEFLASGTLYEERTPFREVRRLLAGRTHRFESGVLADTSAQQLLPTGAGEDRSPPALADVLLGVYEPLLANVLRPYANALPDLTGGLDSRLVLGLLERAGYRSDVTVTGAPRDADVVIAGRLAKARGLSLKLVPKNRVDAVQSDFARVLRAAEIGECGSDAIQYGWIADLHGDHAARYAASINGSGGEVFRNYWWGAADAERTDLDPVAPALRRFAGLSISPDILAPEHRRDAYAHFTEVFRRSLEARAGAAFHVKLDHLYIDLRMQCWQGGLASASNQIWPVISPLMWATPLRALFAASPERRLGGKLTTELLRRFPAAYTTLPLDSGYPPVPAGLSNWWRFLPGLAKLPAKYWPGIRYRVVGKVPMVSRAPIARALCAGGATAFLEPDRMALAPLLDRDAYAAFWKRAGESGDISLPLLGRVIALETAYRAASSR